jgi:hypothetical protein
MAKKVDLRQPQPSQPEDIPFALPEVNLPGVRGQLPLSPGVVGRPPTAVTPEMRENANAFMAQDIPGHTPPPRAKIPEAVPFDQLTPEHQAATLDALRTAGSTPRPERVKPTPQPAVRSSFQPSDPSIAAAHAMAMQQVQEQEVQERARARQAEQTPPPPRPRVNLSSAAPPPPPPPDPPETVIGDNDEGREPQQPQAGLYGDKHLCVHCGWPSDKHDPIMPTRADKQNFVAAVLGGQRFTKVYDLLGGKVRVVFRSHTAKETSLMVRQLVHDWKEGKISSQQLGIIANAEYGMALALHSVETHLGPFAVPMLDEFEADEPRGGGTVIPAAAEWVRDHVIKTEPMRQILADAYKHFLDTLAKLQAQAETPDFWQATEA